MTSPNPTPPSNVAQASSTSSRSSYATATKGTPQGPPPIASSTPIKAGSDSHGQTPLNGNPNMSVPGAPAIVSSSSIPSGPPTGDHNRRTSSVTISAQGTSPYIPNGNAAAQKPNIAFGQMNPTGSPAIANSVPLQNANLTPQANSRVNTRTPSPIAHPPVSGGRPPTGPQGGRELTFGNLPGADGDQSLRPNLPSGPAEHHRRGSQASAHAELPRFGGPHAGRGRGFPPNYSGANMGHSPQVGYRATPTMPPRNISNIAAVPPFQSQVRQGQNSPYQTNRTPVMTPSPAMQPQPHMGNGPHMGNPYYQQHMNAQVNKPFHNKKRFDTLSSHRRPLGGGEDSGSVNHGQPFELAIQDPGEEFVLGRDLDLTSSIEPFLTSVKATNMYNVGDYNMYSGYYPQGYIQPMQQGMQHLTYPNAPPSPRNFTAPHPPQPFMPTAYTPPTQMGRSPSHSGPDRPSSTVQSSTPAFNQSTAPVSTSPAPAQRPKKSSKIVIKNQAGEVVDLKSVAQSSQKEKEKEEEKEPQPAPQSVQPPPIVSSGGVPSASTSTPPPRAATGTPQSIREPPTEKESEETKRTFMEQVQKQIQKEEQEKAKTSTDLPKTPEPAAKPVEEEQVEPEKVEDPAAEEEDEVERMIREMEEQDRLAEEREKAFREKKRIEDARKAAEEAARQDEELRRAEREAEELEEKKLKEASESNADQAENAKLFASLKRPAFGPGATDSGASTPSSEMPPPAAPVSTTPKQQTLPNRGPKPQELKIDTTKPIEPAQPTAGMRSLSNARIINFQKEAIDYPEGFQSPNPALNQGSKNKGRQYDQSFLLQFQPIFKEKPSVNWDKVLKETVGDGSSESARPQSARTPSMGRGPSSRGVPQISNIQMGSFTVNGRTLPPGTTSEARFAASNQSRQPSSFGNQPIGQFINRPGMPFPIAPAMSRTGSTSSRGPQANSPRTGSTRERSKRDKVQEEKNARAMPLTQGKEIKQLEISKTGWKPTSITSGKMAPQTADGKLSPELVQRKVKSALNKMTPNNFEKISDEILTIAAQSKDEVDGRTLRQVIQLTFEKACDESHWSGMYADFCMKMLKTMSEEIRDENVKDKNGDVVVGGALFRKYLLNRCQEEFERGWEVNLPPLPSGDQSAMLSDEYYAAAATKRRGLGLIQFIGELYKLTMLNIRIMHECVLKLLDFEGLPDEANIESLTRLLKTIGATMELDPKGQSFMKAYFDRIDSIMKMDGLPSRLYYMLLDTVDLRRNGWRSKDSDKGPKTIAEIHAEAQQRQIEAERKAASARANRPPVGRGDGRSMSGQFGIPPPDYSRNVGVEDLKRLTRNTRPLGTGTSSFGPQSLLSNSRNNSRRGLGPNSRGAEDSAGTSRTNTPPVKDKESANAFSVLADMDGPDAIIGSPPSTSASPELAKSALATKSDDASKAS